MRDRERGREIEREREGERERERRRERRQKRKGMISLCVTEGKTYRQTDTAIYSWHEFIIVDLSFDLLPFFVLIFLLKIILHYDKKRPLKLTVDIKP